MNPVSETDRLIPWFTLKSVPGIGNFLFKRLIGKFGSPQAVFEADHRELTDIEGISPRIAVLISEYTPPDSVRREIEAIQEKNCRIVLLTDSEYPELLREISDPPPFLYVRGNLSNCTKNIAVVGSRSPTRYGIFTAKRLCEELASLDMTVVSGLARGIDTAAHIGALSGKGKTVAVLGSGLERIYPSENTKLFQKIIENGAVISEFPLNAGPDPFHFPIRNRIISGMSLGTVVVEAAQKSGSLITARFAVEQNREVFAVPGSVHSFKSAGTHSLIRQGAKLVETARDITDELFPTIKTISYRKEISRALPDLSDDEKTVLNALCSYPIHIDDLVRKLDMEPGKISGILLELELKDIVQQSPGKLFSSEYKIAEPFENFNHDSQDFRISNTLDIQRKIKMLPDIAKQQVLDLVDSLLNEYL